jgi:hypothetical protein
VDAARRPSSTLTWLAAAFGCAACALASQIGADARWLAAIGAAIARTGSLPHSIPYAAAPAAPWHDAPALGQLAFHALNAAGGDRALVLAQVAAAACALAFVSLDLGRARVRDGAGAAVLAALLLGAPGTFLVVRAQLFSLALFPLLVLLLRVEARVPSRRIWLAVPLLALWANLHGGVLLGYAVLGAYLVLERSRTSLRTAAAVLAAGGAALFATPTLLHSAGYYGAVLHGGAATGRYGMWGPLSFREPLDLLFVAVAAPLVALALRRRPRAWELVALLALAAMSVEARRNGIWLLLFAAVPAAASFGGAEGTRTLLRRPLALVCACVPLALLAFGLARPPAAGGAGNALVARAVHEAHGTPILADALDAEQLALRGARIWIGNPLEAFDRSAQRSYIEWLRGRIPAESVTRNVRVVLVLRDSETQRRLAADRRFREIGRDDRAVLYRRA